MSAMFMGGTSINLRNSKRDVHYLSGRRLRQLCIRGRINRFTNAALFIQRRRLDVKQMCQGLQADMAALIVQHCHHENENVNGTCQELEILSKGCPIVSALARGIVQMGDMSRWDV